MAVTNKLLAVQNAIVTQLEAITDDAGNYNHDINAVRYGTPDTDSVVGGLPEIFISGFEETGVQRPTNTVRKRLTFTVVGITGSILRFANLGTEVVKLAADIEKAITTDVTLGNVVTFTQLESVSATYFADGTKGVVRLMFFSEYSVTVGDP